MRPRRILVLMQEGLVPPESLEGLTEQEAYYVAMEYDIVNGLRRLGHTVLPLGLSEEILPIRTAFEEHRPHVTFNVLNLFRGRRIYEAHVMSYLELLDCPYTGCNPRGLLISGDKALAKKILAYHRIPTPRFAVVPRGRKLRPMRRMRWPLFVKSAAEESSEGIAQTSVVHDEAALAERVAFVHESIGTAALVEEYVEGRELYVGVLGNQRLQTFPVWELTFGNLAEGAEPIATSKVKWDLAYQKKIGVKTGPARGLDAGTRDRISRMARRIYRVLGLSGYARIDLRLRADGHVSVLEANPNPDLCHDEDFAESAKAAGLAYPALLQRIVGLGMRAGAGRRARER